MSRRRIIFGMMLWGAVYGAGLGILFVLFLRLYLWITRLETAEALSVMLSELLRSFIGGVILGTIFGAVNGLFAGIITLLFFRPLRNIHVYRAVIVLFCTVMSLLPLIWLLTGVSLNWFFWGLIALAGFLGSLLLSRWYIIHH